MTKLFDEKKTHPAFGMLQISRVTTGGVGAPLFGSSIYHNMFFELRIFHGEVSRDVSHDFYFHKNLPILEIALSPIQLIEMIANMNMGSGVPCTILRNNGEEVERLQHDDIESEARKAQKDFKEDVKDLNESVPKLLSFVEELRKKPRVTKKELDEIISRLKWLEQHIRSNLPFVQKSFDEKVERSTMEAQASIDAMFTDIIMKLGVQALQDMYGKQIGSPEDIKPALHA